MDRQMERSLFGNDSAIQSRTEKGTEQRSVDKHALQLDDKSRKKNANKRTSVTIEGLRQRLKQQQYRCALSGVVISPDCASLDHIIPLSKGGTHTIDNVQIVHPVVNALKGTMSQLEFMTWVQLIASNEKPEIDQEW